MGQYSFPILDLKTHLNKLDVPLHINFKDLALKYTIFPLKIISIRNKKRLLLAMANPFDHMAIHDAEFRSGMSVIIVQSNHFDIHWLIETFYFGRQLSLECPPTETEITQDLFAQFEIITNAPTLQTRDERLRILVKMPEKSDD